MGDRNNKQSDLMARDFLGHTNIKIPINYDGTPCITNNYSICRTVPDIGFGYSIPDALNILNETRNLNRDYADENLSRNDFKEQISLLPTEYYGNITSNNNLNTNITGNVERVSRQGRFINNNNDLQSAIPFFLAVIPQIGINQSLNKSQVLPPQAFFTELPVTAGEPAIFYHGATAATSPHRTQYFRNNQQQSRSTRNFEHCWYKGKMASSKANFQSVYGADGTMTRNFGPVGAELAGLRCGVALRNFPSQVNMVRIFPDNRSSSINNLERSSNYFLSQKHAEVYSKHFKIKSEENIINNSKYCLSPPGHIEKRNKSTFVTTSSVHLGGLLTIPKCTDHTIDNSIQTSNITYKSINKLQIANNLALFKESATQGCNEIQKLIKQYNIKSPTINIENFCKNVQRQINNNKNIMQMEPIMREMMLSYLYLSSSWTSLASVLSVPREQSPPLDNCLNFLTKEFLSWQNKSKTMLEQIIISLKKIPQEHEKYIAGVYKTSESSSSENSTIFSDEDNTDSEIVTQHLYSNKYWNNDKILDEYRIKNGLKETTIFNRENNIMEQTISNSKLEKMKDSHENKTELKYNNNEMFSNVQLQLPNKLFKQETSRKLPEKYCDDILSPRQISIVDNCTHSNARRYAQNSNTKKKNYSSNRPPNRKTFNSTVSPKTINRT